MTCQQITTQLDDFLDRELDDAASRELKRHVESCPECREQLEAEKGFRSQLRSIPVVPPTPGFFDRAMKEVAAHTVSGSSGSRSRWLSIGVGGAVAAALTVWLMAGTVFTNTTGELSDKIAGLTIALHETRTVNLVFESAEALPDATLIVWLPDAVGIDGYGDRRQIRWSTDIERGKNVLSLPLVARETGAGELVARVEHSGKQKTFTVKVSVI